MIFFMCPGCGRREDVEVLERLRTLKVRCQCQTHRLDEYVAGGVSVNVPPKKEAK